VEAVSAASSVGTVTRYAPEDHRHAGVGGLGVTNAGNSFGTTGSVAGTVALGAGFGINLSQSTNSNGATITIINAQLVALGGYQDVTTATGFGTDFANVAAAGHVHRGIRAIAPNGTASSFFGDLVISAGNNITLSTGGASTAGSIAIHGANTARVSLWANLLNGTAATFSHLNDEQAVIAPLFLNMPGNMTLGTMSVFFSGISNASMTASHTLTWQFGLYAISDSTALSAIATCSTSFGGTTAANHSASYHGIRAISLPGSIWGGTASSLALTPGDYWLGIWMKSAGSSQIATAIKPLGGRPWGANANAASGMMGQSTATTRAFIPWWGAVRYAGSTTQSALQTSIAMTQVTWHTDRQYHPWVAMAGTGLGTV
jgi:hypothetical protein